MCRERIKNWDDRVFKLIGQRISRPGSWPTRTTEENPCWRTIARSAGPTLWDLTENWGVCAINWVISCTLRAIDQPVNWQSDLGSVLTRPTLFESIFLLSINIGLETHLEWILLSEFLREYYNPLVILCKSSIDLSLFCPGDISNLAKPRCISFLLGYLWSRVCS